MMELDVNSIGEDVLDVGCDVGRMVRGGGEGLNSRGCL